MTDPKTWRKLQAASMIEDAERIREFAGYVIDRINRGRAESCGEYAADITAAGQRLMTSTATVKAIDALTVPAVPEVPGG